MKPFYTSILIKIFITLHFSLFTFLTSQSQNFRSPIDIPLKLAAHFGDIRPNHYHAGLDIETEQKEGLNVYAVADGYVSRIKVAANGYGNALYITHPNGYTSVYGHLQRYTDNISAYLKKNQYEKESFEIDLFPTPDLFPVKKGDVVAFSGNTGDSGGPHVHFEIRDTKTEEPVNPLLFGFDIPDHEPPVIFSLKAYPQYHSGFINNKSSPQKFTVISKNKNSYQVAENSVINVHGNIGFSVEGYDMEDGNDQHFVLNSLELLLDGKPQFIATINRFNFDEKRCVNAHVDYEEMKKTGEQFLKLFREPNDRFSAYKGSGSGVLDIQDTLLHYIKIVAKDVAGNISELNFKIKNNPDVIIPFVGMKTKHDTKVFPYQIPNNYETNDVKITFPEGTLYDTLFFNYSTTKVTSKYYSSIHHIHTIYTPINTAINLSVKCNNIPVKYEEKALIVHLDSKGNASAIKSSYKDGWVSGNPGVLGDFAVMIDTIPPVITLMNNMGNELEYKFKITDNLSGIKSVRATINGKWILLVEDGKTQTYTCHFENAQQYHHGEFLLEAIDNKGNKAIYQTKQH